MSTVVDNRGGGACGGNARPARAALSFGDLRPTLVDKSESEDLIYTDAPVPARCGHEPSTERVFP